MSFSANAGKESSERLHAELDASLTTPQPMLDTRQQSSIPPKECVRTCVEAPVLISAQEMAFGDAPNAFWKKLLADCEAYDKTPEDIISLSRELSRSDPKPASSWLIPIEMPPRSDFWIIGDLHGDLLAFRAITEFAIQTSRKAGNTPIWCFLGDLFDDGPYGHAVLFEVLQLVIRQNGYFVVGNHDLSLQWDRETSKFTADVSPHDFADWLNQQCAECAWRDLARSSVQWFGSARRALLLPDGTLVAHGGCVHSDRLSQLLKAGGSEDAGVLEDLVWLRASDTAKRKVPNRTGRGCQFGSEDLKDFLDAMSRVVGRPVTRVIRGHDHVVERWAMPSRYCGRLLTINAMSWRQREAIGPFARRPVIARHRPNESLDLFQLEIPEELVTRLYGGSDRGECATSGD